MILCCLVAVLGCGVFAVEAKTPQKKRRDRYYGVHGRYRLRKLCGPHYEQRAGNRQGDQGYSGRCSSKEVTVTYDGAKTSPEEPDPKDSERSGSRRRKTCQIVIYGLVNLDGEPGFRKGSRFFDRPNVPQGRGIRSEQNGTGCIRNKAKSNASYHWYFRTFPRSLRRQYSTVCCVLEKHSLTLRCRPRGWRHIV